MLIISAAANIEVFDAPGIWLKHNCLSQTGCLGVVWLEPPMCIDLAFMYIRNLKNNDVEQYKWQWNQENILAAKKRLINNPHKLK